MRIVWKLAAIFLLLCVFSANAPVASRAQRAVAGLRHIKAESAPYSLLWDGEKGTFARAALGSTPEFQWPLVYLHTDPGPKGYSRYLSWFLARDKNDFALLWCYLNDSGREFWCWLYNFSTNQLTTVRFKGEYQFAPPQEARSQNVFENFALTVVPRYDGPDFTFKDWTRREGKIDRLEVKPAENYATNQTPATTLTNLRVQPLHDLRVPSANGWRDTGWREMHALAYDADNNPLYLILYSNSTRGFVLDLKRALTYVADFGATVKFGPDTTRFGNQNPPMIEPLEVRAQRNEPFEITLPSTQDHANPFTEVIIEADMRSPDGKRLVVPGFWDGGKTWHLRFTPTRVGTWTWRVRSNDADLHGQQGEFECVSDEQKASGFLKVNPSAAYRHHFIKGEDTPFYPAFLRDTVHWEPKPAGGVKLSAPSEAQTPTSGDDLPVTFKAFQQRVDTCVGMGINRFFGGYLFDPQAFAAGKQTNEGGMPFFDKDPERPNPAYFQWMDRRILYCNEQGIVPDIGLGDAKALFAQFNEDQLRRVWKYLLARYSAYNVCWNLFHADEALTPELESQITLLGGLTRLYDPYLHPLTVVVNSPAPLASALPVEGEQKPSSGTESGKQGAAVPPQKPVGGPFVPAEASAQRTGNRTQAPTGQKKPVAPPPPQSAPFSDQNWIDVITLSESDINAVWRNWSVEKPVVVIDDTTKASDAVRRRIWETRMYGAYWAGTTTVNQDGTLATESPEAQAAAACARFFQKIRYWRLAPHPEMLGGPQEDANLRRRRKRLEIEASRQKTHSDGSRPDDIPQSPPPADGPIYLLADPAWEYVVYFSKGGGVLLDLLEATGRIRMVWFNPRTGETAEETTTLGGMYKLFTAPDKNDWVLYLSRR